MRVLGICTEGDGGAAVVEDGRILAAVNEERLCRMKLVVGFPRASIEWVLRATGTQPRDLEAVLVADVEGNFVDALAPFHGHFRSEHERHQPLAKRLASPLSRFRNRVPGLEAGYYALQRPGFARRRREIRRILREAFALERPLRFVDHHLAHLTSAYFTSGMDTALALSLDGGGDSRCSRVWDFRAGEGRALHEVAAYDSLGNWYAYVTHLCGFAAGKHEGKITGLAARGEPRYVRLLSELIDEAGGTLHNRSEKVFRAAIEELARRLPRGFTREDLAASIQTHLEQLAGRYVSHWLRRSDQRRLALAGGVSANVRANLALHELPEVERLFVHPHMGDGGLCVGAALAACLPGVLDRERPAHRMARDPEPLAHVYHGPDLSEGAIAAALRWHGLVPERLSGPLEDTVADLLVHGHVVARAAGRMEYGPRALGNRSILYQPTDPAVNDWLNQNLRRTEFMPFAPSLLAELAGDCFDDLAGAEHAAEFMTIALRCTPWMRKHMPGTVHVDDTARPHLVRSDRNPGFHRILAAFHARTGLPGVINTSFNMHEEPIVSSADDAVRAFLDGKLDYLALGDRLIRHPRAAERAPRAVRAR